MNDCSDCDVGKYGKDIGATSCHECPMGKFQDSPGAASETSCSACPSGKVGKHSAAVSESMCDACAPGSYNNVTGASGDCTICGVGKFNKASGSSTPESCTLCEPGSYLEDAGISATAHDSQDDCSKCPRGQYSEANGAADCTACPAAKFNMFEGKSSVEDCLDCPAGTYGNERSTGLQDVNQCFVCAKGKWSIRLGSTAECEECPEGRTTYPLNGTEPDANNYAYHSSADMCDVAKEGYWFEEDLLATEPAIACPGGIEACEQNNECADGYIDVRCAGCDEGFYSSGSGCFKCKSNTTNWVPHVSMMGFVFFCTMFYFLNIKGIRTFLQVRKRHTHTPRLTHTALAQSLEVGGIHNDF